MDSIKTLFPLVKADIQFSRLVEQIHQIINNYSGNYWTDTREHDPGITFLEAMAYVTSDIAYRHSLPLVDLLTPEPALQEEGEGVFPSSFGTHRALTCGPITEEDYRRAILDLHSNDKADGYFFFRNVHFVKEPEADKYTYWFDAENRYFTFNKPTTKDPQQLNLTGNYHLYVEPTRESLNKPEPARIALDNFLRDHTNLCERVSKIIWPDNDGGRISILLELELEDDCQDPARVLAEIYQTAENFVYPLAQRYTTEQLKQQGLSNVEIYQGPLLDHGWIPHLPRQKVFTSNTTLDLSPLVGFWLSIKGIKNIVSLSTNHLGWLYPLGANKVPLVWGPSPKLSLVDPEKVKLIKRGQVCKVTGAELDKYIVKMPIINMQPTLLPYGQFRQPANCYPVTDKLPSCYGLQDLDPPIPIIELYQFFLVFEQYLANACQQLALLPTLLNFNRTLGTTVWGEQWPFQQNTIADQVHQAYKEQLTSFIAEQGQDYTKELEIVDFLLHYFGTGCAPQTLLNSSQDYLATQQGYLREQTELVYQRANIRIDQVSALQKRIAARLGIGAELFSQPIELSKLPFYLLENRTLLPVRPNTEFDDPVKIKQLTKEGDFLKIVKLDSQKSQVNIGQLVDLNLNDSRKLVIRALMIKKVEGNSFFISISENTVLERNISAVLDAQQKTTLTWNNSKIWLMDMFYLLNYANNQAGITSKQKRLASYAQSPFPVSLQVGDEVIISPDLRPDSDSLTDINKDSLISAKAIAINQLEGTYVFESDSSFPSKEQMSSYRWFIKKPIKDNYSFMISLVFNRSLITNIDNPEATERWIKEEVRQEIPAHIGVQLYWFDQQQFDNFALSYARWQNNGAPLGDQAYQLLFQLSLGIKPQLERGISLMRIATPAQKEAVMGKEGNEWNSAVIKENELFYIPKV